MATAKFAISLDRIRLARLDRLVREGRYTSRSAAVQHAVDEHLRRLDHGRLARECTKLDLAAEHALAELGLRADLAESPEY